MHTDLILSMHGYGLYIWTAYGFAALLLGGIIIQTLLRGCKKGPPNE